MEHGKRQVVSVRDLVEFSLRRGSIDASYMGVDSLERAQEGSRIHRMLQSRNKKDAERGHYTYEKEVMLKLSIEYKDMTFLVEGRADGIFIYDDEIIIEEIKTTAKAGDELEAYYNELHWAQVKCYGYIFCTLNSRPAALEAGVFKLWNKEDIKLRVTYYSITTEEITSDCHVFNLQDLEKYFYDILDIYYKWSKILVTHRERRNESIKSFAFPFESYRKGQRDMAVAVYRTISQRKKIFLSAPTGIGKTVSTLYPSVKTVGEGMVDKIFYLTAKTITRRAAEEAYQYMESRGLVFKSITLTAKEKSCTNSVQNCNPVDCPYADGHFDRINAACEDLYCNVNAVDRQTLELYAKKHMVCPFEFALDMALYMDGIICDYNYAFDPNVYLKRFFVEVREEYLFLIDESHNLVDRAREMFSAGLKKEMFTETKRLLAADSDKALASSISKISRYYNSMFKEVTEYEGQIIFEVPPEFCTLLESFTEKAEQWLAENFSVGYAEDVMSLYFEVLNFIKISGFFDERYVAYGEKLGRGLLIKLFCKDPSYLLNECQKRARATVFFSATLMPMEYYINLLGGDEEADYNMRLPSPFDRSKLCIAVDKSVTSKYTERERCYDKVSNGLYAMISAKKGNYIAFFPSYEYMERVYGIFTDEYPEVNVCIQNRAMTEDEREVFLSQFDTCGEGLLAFCVLGGLFSEGIDLRGERLIGVAVVGVGLSKISFEGGLISDYFQQTKGQGYAYSYMFPGINKVMQAVGRVIRTEEDRGVVLLLDNRFLRHDYQNLFPWEWQHYRTVNGAKEIKDYFSNFWQ